MLFAHATLLPNGEKLPVIYRYRYPLAHAVYIIYSFQIGERTFADLPLTFVLLKNKLLDRDDLRLSQSQRLVACITRCEELDDGQTRRFYTSGLDLQAEYLWVQLMLPDSGVVTIWDFLWPAPATPSGTLIRNYTRPFFCSSAGIHYCASWAVLQRKWQFMVALHCGGSTE